jgi:hypothetical protein
MARNGQGRLDSNDLEPMYLFLIAWWLFSYLQTLFIEVYGGECLQDKHFVTSMNPYVAATLVPDRNIIVRTKPVLMGGTDPRFFSQVSHGNTCINSPIF